LGPSISVSEPDATSPASSTQKPGTKTRVARVMARHFLASPPGELHQRVLPRGQRSGRGLRLVPVPANRSSRSAPKASLPCSRSQVGRVSRWAPQLRSLSPGTRNLADATIARIARGSPGAFSRYTRSDSPYVQRPYGGAVRTLDQRRNHDPRGG
jgi:hypothetical protein